MAKKSKYSAVIGTLPALGIDPSRREAVTATQEQIKNSPDELAGPSMQEILADISDSIDYLVNLKKRQTAGRPYASEYARAYAECRAIRDKIAEWDAAFGLLVEAFQWLMIDQLQVEGLKNLTLDSGAHITTYQEPMAKVDDPEAFRRWCLAPSDVCMTCQSFEDDHRPAAGDDAALYGSDGHVFKPGGGLANKMSLHPGTTNTLTKDMLFAGEPEPPGVSVWAKTVVRLGAGDE